MKKSMIVNFVMGLFVFTVSYSQAAYVLNGGKMWEDPLKRVACSFADDDKPNCPTGELTDGKYCSDGKKRYSKCIWEKAKLQPTSLDLQIAESLGLNNIALAQAQPTASTEKGKCKCDTNSPQR